DSKSAWVAYPGGKLEHISCPDFTVMGTYQLPKQAYQLALDGRGILYAVSQLTGKKTMPSALMKLGVADLYLYDTRALPQGDAVLSPTKIISLGGVIQHLFVSPDDAWLYFLDTQNRKIGRIDLKEGKLDGTSIAVAPDTTGLCLTPNGNTLYTCSRSNQVQ